MKQVLRSERDALAVLKVFATLQTMLRSNGNLELKGWPNNLLAASMVCLTKLLSVGEGSPATSQAHLMPYKAASNGATVFQ